MHAARADQLFKLGAGFGYTRARDVNTLLATLSATTVAPVIVAPRLR